MTSNEPKFEEVDQHISKLITEAKARPLPKATKFLAFIALCSIALSSGVWIGYKKATSPTSGTSTFSLAGIGAGAGNFPGGNFNRNFQRNRNNNGGTGTTDLTLPSASSTTVVNLPDDVAGTVVSVTSKSIVVETLSGGKETFPITDTTKVRLSNKSNLNGIKTGDIVTVKPETDKSAKTITIVK